MYIGDGAKLVRDAFELAKQKAPAIIFIDELDAVGTKRFDSDKSGDREVQRTMMELLNQMDGFGSSEQIKASSACVLRSARDRRHLARVLSPPRLLLTLRSSPLPTESTSSTRPFSVQVGWTERLNSPYRTSPLDKISCKYTPGSSITRV